MAPPSPRPTRVLEENGRKRRETNVGIVAAMRIMNKCEYKVLEGINSLKSGI